MELDGISPRRQAFNNWMMSSAENLASFVVKHWLALANAALFLWIALSGLAPFLMSVGLSLPAKALYLFYKAFCHDIPDRHYFIFGYRMTLDHRSLAIYAAMLGVGLIFPLLRDRLRPLNWRIFLVLIAPMAIDGFTQLFGFRQSNWELRTITGALFGVATAWLLLPYAEMGMRNARKGVQRRGELGAQTVFVVQPTAQDVIQTDGKLGR